MEAASQNRKTVAAKIAELYARYPLDKFVWIMPRLDTASELPEHLDLMVSARKFTLEGNDVYPINAKTIEKAEMIGLSKSSLMALAADAGIKWPPNLNRRLDDGYDPDVVEWQSTGILAGLSGMTPVTETKRVDLAHLRNRDEWKLRNRPPWNIVLPGAKWDQQKKHYESTPWGQLTTEQREHYIDNKVTENDMQRKEFKLEMAETKAQLRVVRAILGIPSKFDKKTIAIKGFAVLRIIFAPKAQTARERELILQNMSNMYLGAYPGAETAGQLGNGQEAPVQISPHQVQAALPEASAESVGGERNQQPVSPPADIAEAEVLPLNGEAPPVEDPPPPTTTDNFEFLKAMKSMKEDFVKLLGDEAGMFEYYEPIHSYNVQKSNQIVNEADQKAAYRKLRARYDKLMEEGGGGKEPEDDDGDIWIWKPIRSALGEFTKEALDKSLTEYYNEYGYPIDSDPKGIKAMLTEKRATKAALIDAHVLILKWEKEQRTGSK